MSSRLILHPTAAAAAQALSEAEGGVLLPGDSARGFFAFALDRARRARPFELPDAAERLGLAWAASERARLGLPVSAAGSFARALSDLHGSGLSTEQLRRLRVPQLAAALEAHRKLLAERGLCDPGAVPWLAAEAVARLPAEAIEVRPRLGWTQGELTWLSALAASVPVTVQLPEDPARPKLFALLNPVHQELSRAGRVHFATESAGWGGVWVSSAAGPSATLSATIETHSHGSVADEARSVARRVKALLRSGVPSDAVAVVALGPPALEITAALDAAGVPTTSSEASLKASLAGQAALAVVSAADEGVPRERLCELLEGRLLAVRHSLGWARRLREAGSGAHRQGRLLPPLEALVSREAQDREGLVELAAAVEVIDSLPQQAPLGTHARSLWRTLTQLSIDDRLAKPAPERQVPKPRQLGLFEAEVARSESARGFEAPWVEVAQAEAALALDRVRGLLDSFAGLEIPGRALTLVEFGGVLGEALASTPAPSSRALPGGVTVAPAEALTGRRFGHVFLTGLAGDPPPQPEDVFLPERLRHQAREMCERPAILAPVGASVAQDQQRIGLAMAAALATERLSASGSRSEDGRPIEPSPLLAELARLSAGGLQSHALQPWPTDGSGALNRSEACAALPEEALVTTAEPALAHLQARLRRQRTARERAILERRIDAYAGDLTAEDLAPHLAARLAHGATDPLTATALQTLAGCGFRALAERVFRLRPPEEQDESIDGGRRGTLLHDCLEQGFRALHGAGLLPVGNDARRLEEREVFQAAVRARLAASEEAGGVGHPVVWNAHRRGIERELLRVLEAEQRSGEDFVPAGFEVKLGDEWPSGALAVGGEPVYLGGKVDRIDVGPHHRLRVIDYKSGSLYAKERRFLREFAGRDLQLGHYALALELGRADAPAKENSEPAVDAAFYSIRDAELSKSLAEACAAAGLTLRAFLDSTPDGRAQARAAGSANLPNLIEAHLGRARGGEFAVQPGDCRFCPHGAACRAGGYREDWE